MTYIVQASPLTKIFLPEWHDKCLSNPELIVKVEPFRVVVPRPCGSIELTHNVPVIASSLIAKVKERKVTEDEISPLVEWLTNEQNAETDIYGIVAIPIETNVADAIMALVYDIDGSDKQKKLMSELKKNMIKNINSARERADARVIRQCEKVYNMIKATVSTLKQSGKGVYSPSYSEALALDILKDQIKQRRAPDDRATGIFDKAMADMQPQGM